VKQYAEQNRLKKKKKIPKEVKEVTVERVPTARRSVQKSLLRKAELQKLSK
jgi:hypothetical protein